MQQAILGQKLRYFRNRTQVSQLELETSIGASPGSISRIEAGKINPTKETLFKIARVLNLKHFETSALLGLFSFELTPEEVAAAQAGVDSYLSTNVVAYLNDEYGYLYGISNGFMDLMKLSEDEVDQVLGENILVLALDPSTPVGRIIDPEHIGRTVAIVIARIQQNLELIGTQLYEQLCQTPLFPLVATEMNKITRTDIFSANHKSVHFVIDGQRLRYTFSKEVFRLNPRFEVTEYINPEVIS